MTRGALPPDERLVALLRARDETVFVALLESWSAGMLRVARSYVSTSASAAEVVQDTWLAVIEGIDRFEGRSSVRTWVYRILANTAQRRGSRELRVVPLSGPTVDPDRFQGPDESFPGHWREFPAPWPTSRSPEPEDAIIAAETRDRLADALRRLPERQRATITLRDVEGFTAAEVCLILDISAANQRVLLHRARAFVREELDRYFSVDPEQKHL